MKKGYKSAIYLICLLFVFILIFPGQTIAQNYTVKYFNNENGKLPSAISKVIFKDREGYIWIGTNGGLILYDGYSFKILRDELGSQYVRDIIQTKNGSFLVVTRMGISRVYNGADSMHVVSVLKGTNEPTDSTVCYPEDIYPGKNGSYWIGELNAVVHYRKGHIKRFHFPGQNSIDYSSKSFSFDKTSTGQLLLTSSSGDLYFFDSKSDSFKKIKLPLSNVEQQNFSINAIINQPGGWVWIGTSKGIYRFQFSSRDVLTNWQMVAKMPSVSCITKLQNGHSFVGTWLNGLYEIKKKGDKFKVNKLTSYRNNEVNSLSLGSDGELWISSDYGFALMYPRFFLTASIPSKSKFIHSIILKDDSTVYVTNGFRIYRSEKAGNTYKLQAVSESLPHGILTSLAFLNGKLITGTKEGDILELTGNTFHKIADLSGNHGHSIRSIYAYKGHLWICQVANDGVDDYKPGGDIIKYGPSKGGNTVFRVLTSDRGKSLMAGSEGVNTYLYKFDPKKNRFVNISAKLPRSLLKKEHKKLVVNALTFYEGNNVLLATNYGLLQVKLNGFSKATFVRKLINDYFESVLVDKNQDIWLGSEKGLFISYRGELTRIDISDGLPSLSITSQGVKLDKKSRLWVGTSYGLAYSKKPMSNLGKAPKPRLLNVKVNGKKYPYKPGQVITVISDSRIKLKLTALSYPTDKIHFETILADKKSHILYLRSASKDLVSIPVTKTGDMDIYIVTNQSGYKWSKPLVLNLRVLLPWYRRWWAYIFYVLALIFVGYTITDYARIRKVQRREREKFETQDRIMWQTLDVVPHFVYARDSEGRYLIANKALLQAYNTTREFLTGRKDSDVIGDGDESDSILKSDHLVIKTGKPVKVLEDFVSPDGLKKHLQVTKIPLRLPNEQLSAVAGVAVDITELASAQAELRESEQRLKILSDASYEGIVIAHDGKIVDINERLSEITGFNREDIVGKMVWDFVPPDKLQALQDQVEIGFDEPFETELFKVDYSRIPIVTRGREFIFQGNVMRMISIRDITNERKAQNELREYARKLEVSNKELQDFAYVASHDLQEPLRKIQAFGDLLFSDIGDKLDEDSTFYLERMRSASQRMQKLINGLLSFSRVTTKARPYELVDLNRIVREVLNDLEIRIQETNAEFVIGELTKIDADPLQMRQLFQNIIGNALKFVKNDEKPMIKIQNKTVTEEEDGALLNESNRCIITISDNGIGFDQKYADKVFSVFERLHTRSQYEGTGIGLAICRKIVERHDGEISVESRLNEGTTFIIKLPIRQNAKNM